VTHIEPPLLYGGAKDRRGESPWHEHVPDSVGNAADRGDDAQTVVREFAPEGLEVLSEWFVHGGSGNKKATLSGGFSSVGVVMY
jgi:hypothetical protein